jgi:hypothetical protein
MANVKDALNINPNAEGGAAYFSNLNGHRKDYLVAFCGMLNMSPVVGHLGIANFRNLLNARVVAFGTQALATNPRNLAHLDKT